MRKTDLCILCSPLPHKLIEVRIFREHEDDFDAQTVYEKLHGFHATRAGSRVSASEMLSYMTSAKF